VGAAADGGLVGERAAVAGAAAAGAAVAGAGLAGGLLGVQASARTTAAASGQRGIDRMRM
jgi:hypothetical protein